MWYQQQRVIYSINRSIETTRDLAGESERQARNFNLLKVKSRLRRVQLVTSPLLFLPLLWVFLAANLIPWTWYYVMAIPQLLEAVLNEVQMIHFDRRIHRLLNLKFTSLKSTNQLMTCFRVSCCCPFQSPRIQNETSSPQDLAFKANKIFLEDKQLTQNLDENPQQQQHGPLTRLHFHEEEPPREVHKNHIFNIIPASLVEDNVTTKE